MEHCIHAEDIGKLKESVDNLEGWQKSQNGTIHRVEIKVEKLQYWIMGVLVTCIFTLVTLFTKG
jgi:hypothetical protein